MLPNLALSEQFCTTFSYFLLALQNLYIIGFKTQVDFWHVVNFFLKPSVLMVDKVRISENYPQFSFTETKGN